MANSTYQTKVYMEQGGDRMVIAPAGELLVEGAIRGLISGTQYFVDSVGGTATGDGLGWSTALTTIDAAIGLCTADVGDEIHVAAGHTETLTTKITADIAGISIIGHGVGTNRPQITVGGTIDGIDVTAANVVLENLYFNEATAAATSNINIAAANVTLRKIHMDLGTNDVDAVTVTAAGELPTIEECTAIVTANGPDSWVKFEGVVDRPIIRGNVIVGSDGTNAFDDGVLDFNSVAVTNPAVYSNVFNGAGQTTVVMANVGSVTGGLYGPNAYGGSATDADNVSGGAASITTVTDALYGTNGIATFPTPGVAAGNNVSLAEVVRYIQDQVINGTGTVLATDTSLYGVLAGATGIPSFPNAAVPAANVSIAEVLRSVWAALLGTAAGENGITTWPAAAAPANDVSIAEAIRYIVETQLGLAATTLAAHLGVPDGTTTESLHGKLGTDTELADRSVFDLMVGDGPATYPVAAPAANDVSVAEVLRYVQDMVAGVALNRNATNYLAVTADLTNVTWNTQAAHEIFTVTGAVRMRILPQITGTVTSAAAGITLVLGDETTTNSLITSTDGDDLAVGEWWFDSTATRTLANKTIFDKLDFVVGNGKDIGYTIGGEAATGGSIVFHCWWEPIDATGAVAAGAGGAL